MVAADPGGGPAPRAPEPARPSGAGSGAGLRARVGGARQGLLEPGPECRWDHIPHRRGLLSTRAGTRLMADRLQAPRDRADVDALRGARALACARAAPPWAWPRPRWWRP